MSSSPSNSRSTSQESLNTSTSSSSLKLRGSPHSPQVSKRPTNHKAKDHSDLKNEPIGDDNDSTKVGGGMHDAITVSGAQKPPSKHTHSHGSWTAPVVKDKQSKSPRQGRAAPKSKTEEQVTSKSFSDTTSKQRKAGIRSKTDEAGFEKKQKRSHSSHVKSMQENHDTGYSSISTCADLEVESKATMSKVASPVTLTSASVSGVKPFVFPDVEIVEENQAELFKTIAISIDAKWQDLGRYLGLEDSVLNKIDKRNHFNGEKCMKMLIEWKTVFQQQATYFKLEESLRNIKHEDLLSQIQEFVPQIEECITGGKEYTLQLTPDGISAKDLKLIEKSFQSNKSNGMTKAKMTLTYTTGNTGDHSEPLTNKLFVFSVDLCCENCLCVFEDLCTLAARLRNVSTAKFIVEYS